MRRLYVVFITFVLLMLGFFVGKYLSFGIIFGFAFQTLLNLMVVVGLIPVTGVTLPFLSYGGSSLLITLCSMGIILNISRYIK